MARMAQVLAGVALALGGWVAGTATGCGTAHAGSGEQTSVECTDGAATLKASGSKEDLILWRAYGYEEDGAKTAVQLVMTAVDGQARVRCDAPSVSRVVFVSP